MTFVSVCQSSFPLGHPKTYNPKSVSRQIAHTVVSSVLVYHHIAAWPISIVDARCATIDCIATYIATYGIGESNNTTYCIAEFRQYQ